MPRQAEINGTNGEPSRLRLLVKQITSRLRLLVKQITSLNDTPSALAKGVACALFAALTPFFGVKVFLALGLARFCKANLAATGLAYLSCNLIVPFLPFIMSLQYGLGYLLIHGTSTTPFHELKGAAGWQLISLLGWPLVLGALLTATLAGFLAYIVSIRLIGLRIQRRTP